MDIVLTKYDIEAYNQINETGNIEERRNGDEEFNDIRHSAKSGRVQNNSFQGDELTGKGGGKYQKEN